MGLLEELVNWGCPNPGADPEGVHWGCLTSGQIKKGSLRLLDPRADQE